MSSAIPNAFGDRGLVFAVAFVVVQVGRATFVVATTAQRPGLRRTFFQQGVSKLFAFTRATANNAIQLCPEHDMSTS